MKYLFFLFALLAIVFTNRTQAQNVYGEMQLDYEDGYLLARTQMPDGDEAWFAVDLAVSTSAVVKDLAGDRTMDKPRGSIDPLQRSVFHFALGGFGVSPEYIGEAKLAQIDAGGLTFPNVNVDVVNTLPDIAGRTIAGIFGVDLLRRAEVAVFMYGEHPRLLLKSKARSKVTDVIEIPFRLENDYIVTEGILNDGKVDVLLDTGSPDSYLPVKTLRATGAAAVPNSTREITLLDGSTAKVRRADISSFTLGGTDFDEQLFHLGELPVFTLLPESSTPILLGNSFFSELRYVQINFTTNTVRLKMQ